MFFQIWQKWSSYFLAKGANSLDNSKVFCGKINEKILFSGEVYFFCPLKKSINMSYKDFIFNKDVPVFFIFWQQFEFISNFYQKSSWQIKITKLNDIFALIDLIDKYIKYEIILVIECFEMLLNSGEFYYIINKLIRQNICIIFTCDMEEIECKKHAQVMRVFNDNMIY